MRAGRSFDGRRRAPAGDGGQAPRSHAARPRRGGRARHRRLPARLLPRRRLRPRARRPGHGGRGRSRPSRSTSPTACCSTSTSGASTASTPTGCSATTRATPSCPVDRGQRPSRRPEPGPSPGRHRRLRQQALQREDPGRAGRASASRVGPAPGREDAGAHPPPGSAARSTSRPASPTRSPWPVAASQTSFAIVRLLSAGGDHAPQVGDSGLDYVLERAGRQDPVRPAHRRGARAHPGRRAGGRPARRTGAAEARLLLTDVVEPSTSVTLPGGAEVEMRLAVGVAAYPEPRRRRRRALHGGRRRAGRRRRPSGSPSPSPSELAGQASRHLDLHVERRRRAGPCAPRRRRARG